MNNFYSDEDTPKSRRRDFIFNIGMDIALVLAFLGLIAEGIRMLFF